MKKVTITRACFIQGLHYEAGKMAEVTEDEAHILVGMGKAVHGEVKSEAKSETKKKKK